MSSVKKNIFYYRHFPFSYTGLHCWGLRFIEKTISKIEALVASSIFNTRNQCLYLIGHVVSHDSFVSHCCNNSLSILKNRCKIGKKSLRLPCFNSNLRAIRDLFSSWGRGIENTPVTVTDWLVLDRIWSDVTVTGTSSCGMPVNVSKVNILVVDQSLIYTIYYII
jgi:hypothetical protein